jgi:hypothetical protein
MTERSGRDAADLVRIRVRVRVRVRVRARARGVGLVTLPLPLTLTLTRSMRCTSWYLAIALTASAWRKECSRSHDDS